MNDLLGDVRSNNPAYTQREGGGDVEVALPLPPASEQQASMQAFFSKVEDIKTDINEIRSLQREVNELHERGKTIIKTSAVKEHQELMQDKVNQVNSLASKVKRKVEDLDKDNEKAKTVKGGGQDSANERTRTAITAGLKRKLKDLMGEFSDLRNRIQDEYRDLVGRRLQTVTGEKVSEEDVDRVIETGEAENLFQKAFQEQGRGRVLDVLAEIQERNKAVKDLEQSLMELHQIFLDMAVLVEAQGETLDSIQKQVERATNYVQTGADALVDAKNLQRNTRKWMCVGIIALLIIIIIIVLAIQPWKLANN